MTRKIYIHKEEAPEYWASYLINDDDSGLEADEKAQCDEWRAKHKGAVVDCAPEGYIGRWNGLQTKLISYTFHSEVRNG